MEILLLTGSPHKKGTSALLAERFAAGARDAGHTVQRFDAAFAKLGPCRACDACKQNAGVCIQQDDMAQLKALLRAADMIVFVTPLYYFGMSAQLKCAIDRFYAINDLVAGKKSALIATCADARADAPMDALISHYKTIVHYLKLNDCGQVLAFSAGKRCDIEQSIYPDQAYAFARSLE